jgi:hypothetical protein
MQEWNIKQHIFDFAFNASHQRKQMSMNIERAASWIKLKFRHDSSIGIQEDSDGLNTFPSTTFMGMSQSHRMSMWKVNR